MAIEKKGIMSWDEIDGLGGRVTVNEGDIVTINGQLVVIDGRITTNENDITTIEGQITVIEGRVTVNENDIATLDGQVITLDGRITANENDIVTINGQIVSLDGRVTANENDIVTLYADKLDDAPSDGFEYVRKNGAWIVNTGGAGAVPEAPEDGKLYGRKDVAWVEAESKGDGDTNRTAIALNKDNLDVLRTGPTVGGTANAITLSTVTIEKFDRTIDLNPITFIPTATNTGPTTVNTDGDGIVDLLQTDGVGGTTALVGGEIVIGVPTTVYRRVTGDFFLWTAKGGDNQFLGDAKGFAVTEATTGTVTKLSVTDEGYLHSFTGNSSGVGTFNARYFIDSVQILPSITGSFVGFSFAGLNYSFAPMARFESGFSVGFSGLCMIAYSTGDKDISKCIPKFYSDGAGGVGTTIRKSVTGKKGVITNVWGNDNIALKIDDNWIIGASAADGIAFSGGLTTAWYFEDGFEFYTDDATDLSGILWKETV